MAQVDLKSPAVQKLILFVLAGVSLLGLFFFTHFVPFGFLNQREKIQMLHTEYEKKATELARARATVADLPRFEAEYALQHERWAQAAELLPTDRQLPALMRKITLAAQQNGVSFMSFRPTGMRQDQHFTESPIQLSVVGNYHQIGAFLADLANLRRIVTVANLSLKPNTKLHSLGVTTAAEFTASGYHLNTGATAPAQPAVPAKKKEGADHEHAAS